MRLTSLLDDISEDELFEMTRIPEKRSGIKPVLFASYKSLVQSRHGPRIKESNIPGTFSPVDNFSVSISDEPQVITGHVRISNRDLEDVFDWVKLNRDVLLKFWNERYEDSGEFLDDVLKV